MEETSTIKTCYVCGQDDNLDNLIVVKGEDDQEFAHPECQESIEFKYKYD